MIPALGLIETLGLVPLLNALDAALKSANVKPISGVIKLDGGIVAVMIAGDVSSVRAAVEAGAGYRRYRDGALHCPRYRKKPDLVAGGGC